MPFAEDIDWVVELSGADCRQKSRLQHLVDKSLTCGRDDDLLSIRQAHGSAFRRQAAAFLGSMIDWENLDEEIAPLYSDKGRLGIASRFVIGLMLSEHIFALSDEEACERWAYDPYVQYFPSEELFQHRSRTSGPT